MMEIFATLNVEPSEQTTGGPDQPNATRRMHTISVSPARAPQPSTDASPGHPPFVSPVIDTSTPARIALSGRECSATDASNARRGFATSPGSPPRGQRSLPCHSTWWSLPVPRSQHVGATIGTARNAPVPCSARCSGPVTAPRLTPHRREAGPVARGRRAGDRAPAGVTARVMREELRGTARERPVTDPENGRAAAPHAPRESGVVRASRALEAAMPARRREAPLGETGDGRRAAGGYADVGQPGDHAVQVPAGTRGVRHESRRDLELRRQRRGIRVFAVLGWRVESRSATRADVDGVPATGPPRPDGRGDGRRAQADRLVRLGERRPCQAQRHRVTTQAIEGLDGPGG